jgi:hypothetical protein
MGLMKGPIGDQTPKSFIKPNRESSFQTDFGWDAGQFQQPRNSRWLFPPKTNNGVAAIAGGSDAVIASETPIKSVIALRALRCMTLLHHELRLMSFQNSFNNTGALQELQDIGKRGMGRSEEVERTLSTARHPVGLPPTT